MSVADADLLAEGITMKGEQWGPSFPIEWHYACAHCRFVSSTHEQQSKVRYDARQHALSTRHQNRKGLS